MGPSGSGTGAGPTSARSASARIVPELAPVTIPMAKRSGERRDSSTPHHFGRGQARSNDKTTTEQSVMVVEVVVAGVEHFELIGGEALGQGSGRRYGVQTGEVKG